jgi:hypothetical protein
MGCGRDGGRDHTAVITGQLTSMTWQIVTTLLVGGAFCGSRSRCSAASRFPLRSERACDEARFSPKVYGLRGR